VKDHVDVILEQWRRELPSLDSSPMAVIGRISRLAALLQDQLEPVFQQYGLNGGEFDVLAALRRAGRPYQLAPAELSRSLMVTSGGLTKRLKSLERAGLIARVPNADDGRSSLVQLTAKGRKLVETVVAAHYANEKRLLAGLDVKSRRQLVELLRRFLVSLEDGNT
jgi:DNA-binding MarR family transcriptional regulator